MRPPAVPPFPLFSGPIEELCSLFVRSVSSGKGVAISYLNAHVLDQALVDASLKEALSHSDYLYCDGFGAVLALCVLESRRYPRATALDFLPFLLSLCAANKLKVGIIGGRAPTMQRAVHELCLQIPGLELHHLAEGYPAPPVDKLAELITTAGCQVVFNALGTPRQERSSLELRRRQPSLALWNVGGAFGYYSGEELVPPRLPSKVGMEWLYRLKSDPSRLWKRYLVGAPRVLLRCLGLRFQNHG